MEHRPLVPQGEDLDVLLDLARRAEAKHLEETTGEETDEREGHDLPAWSVSKARSRPVNE
ncbi:MAG: hypothetical protein ACYDC0_11500 [Acidimicrobiales bacterium]